jgi:crotonobetaine/carnitine-CoA ligase
MTSTIDAVVAGEELLPGWGPEREWVLPRLLRRQAARFAERPFVQVEEAEAETYAEVLAASELVARRLASVGVGRGDFVVLLLPTSLDVIHCWFGVGLLGAVDVPLNIAYRGPTLTHGVNLSAAKVLVCAPELLHLVADVEHDLTSLEVVVTPGPIGGVRFERLRHVTLDELPLAELPDIEDLRHCDPSTVLFTSGTTGPAKGVVFAHAQAYAVARQTIDGLRLTEDDVFYCFHPLFHMSKFAAIAGPMLLGGRVVLDRQFTPETWLDHARRYGATATIGHGPMLEMIHATPERPDDADNPLRVVLAAPFPSAIAADFERRFAMRGIETWGMTEVTVAVWQSIDEPLRVGSCGRPVDRLFDIRVVDPETDEPLAAGQVGEITVTPKQPWVMMQGYLAMPEKTVEAWRNLRFHTGDAGFFDEDGYLHFVDRGKDRIRRRAENISSYDIEAAACAHPAVAEAAAVGVPSKYDGDDDIKLCVVAPAGVDVVGLFEHLVRTLPHHMVPMYIEVLDALPRTPTNKVQKQPLRDAGVSASTWDRKAEGMSVRETSERLARERKTEVNGRA